MKSNRIVKQIAVFEGTYQLFVGVYDSHRGGTTQRKYNSPTPASIRRITALSASADVETKTQPYFAVTSK